MITDTLADRVSSASLRNERSLVNEPARARRLLLAQLVGFVVVLLVFCFTTGPLASLLVGSYIGLMSCNGLRRMFAYRNGWLDGRRSILTSLTEAQRRGMTLEEWGEAEMLRDFTVLGIDITVEAKHRREDDDDG